jgi:two-component system CheB/CheR fusion protein
VTNFFRDPDLFDYLRERVLPDLMERAAVGPPAVDASEPPRRGGMKELRIWSAGCATGEEAYSLAILLAETLGDELTAYNVRIFATDIDSEAIAYGRRGVYPVSALQDLHQEQLLRYFTPLDGGYEVKRFIRRLVIFGQHDLG